MMIKNLKLLLNEKSANKRLVVNSIQSVLIKGGAVIVSLLTLPAYLRFFEDELVLGVWFTIISIISWVLTFDLGIGNGLRNHLVECLVKKDYQEAKKYISSAYLMIIVTILFFAIGGYYYSSYLNWNIIFNVSTSDISSEVLLRVVRLMFIGIMLQFVLKLISSILLAMQKAAVPGLINLVASVLLLITLSLAVSNSLEENLLFISKIYIVTVNLPFVFATIFVFSFKLKDARPNFRFFSMKHAIQVIKLGGIFFWLQLMTMLIFATNEFLISWLTQPDDVVDFHIYNRLFALISTMFLIALTPVWSAGTEATFKKDYFWIENLYIRLNKLAIFLIGLELILILTLPFIVDLWIGSEALSINIYYSSAFALLGILYIYLAINSSIVAGIGILKTQFILLTLGALMNFPMSFLFTNLTGSWIGVVIANIFSILPYCIIQPIILKKYLNKKKLIKI